MIYGALSEKRKELKRAIIILDSKELDMIMVACEEYWNAHPRMKKIQELIRSLEDIAVF